MISILIMMNSENMPITFFLVVETVRIRRPCHFLSLDIKTPFVCTLPIVFDYTCTVRIRFMNIYVCVFNPLTRGIGQNCPSEV